MPLPRVASKLAQAALRQSDRRGTARPSTGSAPAPHARRPAGLVSPAGLRIFLRDAFLCGLIGPFVEFLYGFLFYQFTGSLFAEFYVLSVYGHTSLLSGLVWGVTGGALLQIYRRLFV